MADTDKKKTKAPVVAEVCPYDALVSTGTRDKIEAPMFNLVMLFSGDAYFTSVVLSDPTINPAVSTVAVAIPSDSDYMLTPSGPTSPGNYNLAVTLGNVGRQSALGTFLHNYDHYLSQGYTNVLTENKGDGTTLDYQRQGSSNVYASDKFLGIITVETGPDRFVLTGANGTTSYFNSLSDTIAPGRMYQSTDRYGNTMTFDWVNQGGVPILTQVTDSFGRTATYEYSDSATYPLLLKVTDPAKRTICFQYDDENRLVAIIGPIIARAPAGNLFPYGIARAFAYDTKNRRPELRNNLIAMWAPNEATPYIKPGECKVDMERMSGTLCVDNCGVAVGVVVKGSPKPYMRFRYGQDPTDEDTFNKVIEKIDGDPENGVGGTTSYMYITNPSVLPENIIDPSDPIVLRAIVTDRNGNQLVYDMNENGMAVRIEIIATREKNSLQASSYVTWKKYNAQNQPVEIVFPEGNTIQLEYETGAVTGITGTYVRRRGLLLRVTKLPGNSIGIIPTRAGSNGQEILTQRYFYEPLFAQLCAAIETRGNPVTLAGAYFTPQNDTLENGGTTPTNADRSRYATIRYFDYQKNERATVTGDSFLQQLLFPGVASGTAATMIGALIDHVDNQMKATGGTGGLPDGFEMGLGDINGDGTGDGDSFPATKNLGRMVARRSPKVLELLPTGGTPPWVWTDPPIERYEIFTVNYRGQVTTQTDAEGNVSATLRYPYSNPEGNSEFIVNAMGNNQYGFIREGHVDVDPFDVMSLIGTDGDLVDFRLVYPRNSRTNTTGTFQDLVTRYEAGGSGGGCSSCAYDAMGNALGVTDPRGFTTRFERNELGEVYRQIAPGPYDFKVETYRDANRNTIRVDTEDKIVKFESNDPTSPDYAKFTPSGSGDVANVPMEAGPGGAARPGWFTNLYAYDILNDRIEEDLDATGSFPASLLTKYEYDPNQNLIKVVKPQGNIVEYDYDERNLRIATRVGYDPEVDEPGAVTVNVHDKNGNLLDVIGPAERGTVDNSLTVTISDAFDSGSALVHTGDWVVENIYDGFDRKIKSIDAVGGTIEYKHDPDARVIQQTFKGTIGGATPDDRTGSDNQTLSIDQTRFNEGGWAYENQQQVFIALNTQLSQEITAVGGGLAANSEDNDHDDPVTLTDGSIKGLGPIDDSYLLTRTVFDRNGRVTAVGQDNTGVARFGFDGANRQIVSTDALNNVIETRFDRSGNAVSRKSTEQCTITNPADIPTESFESAMRYDALNRLVVSTEPAINGSLTSATARKTIVGYDSRGNTTAVIDPKENTTLKLYDGASRGILTVQHLRKNGQGANGPLDGMSFLADGGSSVATSTVFDGNGRVVRLIDDRGGITSYEYDTLDRQVKLIYNDGATLTNEYDAASDVTRFVDANGSIIDSTFDPLGRKVLSLITRSVGVVGTNRQEFLYDGLSRLVSGKDIEVDVLSSIVVPAYDSISRTIEEKQTAPSLNRRTPVFTEWTSWNPTEFMFPNSRAIEFGNDELYRCNQITEASGSSNIAHWEFFGSRVAEVQLGNGLTCSMMNNNRNKSAIQVTDVSVPAWGDNDSDRLGYDGGGRMITKRYVKSVLDLSGGYLDPTSIVGFTTEYDLASNKLYERHLHAESRSHLYEPFIEVDGVSVPQGGYDSLDRLRQYQRGELSSTVGLDGNGGGEVTTPISLPNTDTIRTYTLDGLGNWRTTEYTPVSSSSIRDDRQHNHLNEITRRKVAADTDDFTYDPNGNLLNDGVRKYEYDVFNRVAAVYKVSNDDTIATYTYDVINRRTQKNAVNPIPPVGGTVFECVYVGWRCVETRSLTTNNPLIQSIWGRYLDENIQQKNVAAINNFASGSVLYPMQDLLYRNMALGDSVGDVREAYDTDAYGNTLIFRKSGTPPAQITFSDGDTQVDVPTCDFIFTGQRYDYETEIYYYKNRYYSPGLGRFLTRDPSLYMGYVGNYSVKHRNVALDETYQFVRSNPIIRFDPEGLLTKEEQDACCEKAKAESSGVKGRNICCDGEMVQCVYLEDQVVTKEKAGKRFEEFKICWKWIYDMRRACIRVHEESHAADCNRCPQNKGISDPPNRLSQYDTEHKAYDAYLKCAQEKLKNLPAKGFDQNPNVPVLCRTAEWRNSLKGGFDSDLAFGEKYGVGRLDKND